MAEIIPNQTFKHGGKTYEEGEIYNVSPELAAYFQQAGWIGEKLIGNNVTLDVQDVYLGHSSEVK